MQLPQRRPSGNCVPESVNRTGRSFQMSPHAENPSRNEPPERDTLSETRPIGKPYPGLSVDSGTQFPADAETESASRYRCLERDALSQWMLMRKLRPTFRVGCNFRLSLDWETTSHSHKNGRLGCWSEPSVWRVMSRHLARYVIPDDAVAIGENVVAASRVGRYAVDRVHPAACTTVLLLGQTTDSGDIRAVR